MVQIFRFLKLLKKKALFFLFIAIESADMAEQLQSDRKYCQPVIVSVSDNNHKE
jgi:hypothetical protein